MYADDTQLYVSFKPGDEQVTLRRLEQCVNEIKRVMGINCLKLNETKTEVLVVHKKDNNSLMEINTAKIGDDIVQTVNSAKNIGVIIDSNLCRIKFHISAKSPISLKTISKILTNITEVATDDSLVDLLNEWVLCLFSAHLWLCRDR